jgi:microcystin degradation protein MlrC
MRVAIAELKQETNTFVPRLTTYADFEAWHHWTGPDLIEGLGGTNAEIDGFLRVLTEAGIEPVPILATFAMSGGKVEDETYDRLLSELLDGLSNAGKLDGILIALHGAMVTESDDDPDASTLKAIRELVGPDIPVVATYDLHANLTASMASYADALVGFKTSPHIDVMMAILQQGAKPAMAFVKIPMVVPASTHIHHLPGPFKRLQDATKELEKEPGVLSANVAAVQPWLDIDEMGFATVVVTDNDPGRARTLASDLAKACWHERDAFMEIQLVPIDEAIRQAVAEPSGPVVLSDCADGTGAGSPGDATAVIAALLEANPEKPALVYVRDAESAEAAIAAGTGATVTLSVGGKLDNVFNKPVQLTGTVEFAGPASFRFGGEGYTGVEQDMGPSAVVRAGNVYVLICSNSVMTVDPELYRAVGMEPLDAQIVVVKSHIQFRGGYPFARRIVILDSPGFSNDHIASLPWQKVPRPIFPLDPEMSFTCEPLLFTSG